MLKTIKLLGVSITAEKEEKVLEYILQGLKSSSKKLFIITPNPEIVVYAQAHPDYKDKLNTAEASLPDGVGVVIASQLLGKPLKSRITGADFIEKLCMASREQPVSMGFLGGRGGVAEETANRLQKKYPWIKVGFVGEEWPEDLISARGPAPSGVTPRFNETKIDILFVAFGFPKQEEWIYENLPRIPVKAAMGVGGAFDYISGEVMRAPKVVRMLGLEWFFRLIRQPWRWKRQLALRKFLVMVIKERFSIEKERE